MKSKTTIMGVPGSSTLTEAVALEAVDKLRDTYIPWLERALAKVDETVIWQRPRPGVNSIGNLLLHLNGNVRQWIHFGIAGEENNRDRTAEFAADKGEDGQTLLANLTKTVLEACEIILDSRSEEEWLRSRSIQGFSTTALAAIVHVTEHFAYHTGQIVLLVKSATGTDLGFYDLD
ncbi:DUF1572 domain-containing protein [bacterium]|nr:DUF1572 domain-containing protein [bacterium]